MESTASERSGTFLKALSTPARGLGLLGTLLLFFAGIELLETSFELMGRPAAQALLEATANPSVGLFIGILATSLVQSSSTVTSMTVAVVAGGGLTIPQAIPIMMGANIGTSVTNTVVSFGSVTRRDEFRRAMAGATVHDFFNLLTVAVLFPLELAFGVVSRTASVLTDGIAGAGGFQLFRPLDHLMDPLMRGLEALVGQSGPLVLVMGLVIIFASLRLLIRLLRALVMGPFEGLLDRYIFDRPAVSFMAGAGLTFLVQSSSITTSLMVPLVAARVLTVAQVFPFVLGANTGTTLTAIVAALATGEPAALTVALAHLTFNVLGFLLFFPIRRLRAIPIRLAEALGRCCGQSRLWAVGYVIVVFFVIPLVVIIAMRGTDFDYEPVAPDPVSSRAVDDVAVGDVSARHGLAGDAPQAGTPEEGSSSCSSSGLVTNDGGSLEG